ncbi:DUF1302 domain-containing protein [Pseudomonas sp. JQ170]|uniref:DUF1302 domain-containing protein n=1 Tax=unclassified Pseudomonas TaxID=196821 RepID=UPI00264FE12F|nr:MULTISPECIES: DUF1302 domain-containing protein [unclassified Pseudomonas]MDN7143957.1 DUF1302 domain-containing protein [Pseudomonas sp. JQ170]WRO78383.1 DUF1302 domain-containing protein [Pseudomonas sp. 170C]
MQTIIKRANLHPTVLATAIALAWGTQAQAVNFTLGEIEGTFDSSLSIGASWATQDADPDFISNFNVMGEEGRAASRTADDGRLNFKKHDAFSKIFKGIHDLSLKYEDSGVFVRGKYWYDFELKDGDQDFYDIDDHGRDRSAKASGAEFLDAFVYHNYQIGDLPGNVRLGKQVVSWGESTFIQNSINAINPIDVAALRRPGAEVKEGLIPVNMFYLSQGLTENLTAEMFYQLEWDKTVTDNCGTFFGGDPVSKGCNDRLVITGPDFAPGVASNSLNIQAIAQGLDNAYIPRAKDHEPGDSGQFGLAMRWFLPELNDTEVAAYAMNYHSRSPYLSFTRTTVAGAPTTANTPDRVRTASYFVDYPEDIRLYGLSFQTNVSGVALGGEVSYRPNMPLQINTADLNLAAVNQIGLINGVPGAVSPVFVDGFATNAPGAAIPGYKRMPVTQVQVTATKFFDQVLAASRLTLVGEVGYNRVSGLSTDTGDVRFGRSPTYGAGALVDNGAVCTGTAAGTPTASNPQQECNNKGYYTSDSWGYRVRGKLDYPNVIAGINFSPSLAWSHDVNGTGVSFEEGAKAVSLGLDADYQNTYTASLSYTNYFGGDFNTLVDRDFMSLSVGVNF